VRLVISAKAPRSMKRKGRDWSSGNPQSAIKFLTEIRDCWRKRTIELREIAQ